MKKLISIAALCLLSACTSVPVAGRKEAPSKLRHDPYFSSYTAEQWERLKEQGQAPAEGAE